MGLSARLTAPFSPTRAFGIKAFFGIALLGALADQLTKLVVFGYFEPRVEPVKGALSVIKTREPLVMIDGYFHLMFNINTGIGWSLLSDRSTLIALVSALIITGLVLWACFLKPGEQGLRLGLGLVLGGAIGNLTDRLVRGYVIDFIDLHWHTSYQHPIFNVADIVITVGIIMLFMASLTASQPASAAAQPAAAEPKTQEVL